MHNPLKAARLEKGYTQKQMAAYLGYKSKSGYCMIERGTNTPSLSMALKISQLLNRPVEELFHDQKVHDSRTNSIHIV